MGDTPGRKGCLHGECIKSQEEKQEERESVWKAVRIRVHKLVFTKPERTEIYDSIMEKVERILSAMNQSGQTIIELAWRIALESWLQSKGYIKGYINIAGESSNSAFCKVGFPKQLQNCQFDHNLKTKSL